jgi:hypothetical protein
LNFKNKKIDQQMTPETVDLALCETVEGFQWAAMTYVGPRLYQWYQYQLFPIILEKIWIWA